MAQPYLQAMDHASWRSKALLKKREQKRPLGRIERYHKYTPPQPVLSSRCLEVDVSGTRTYRAKSPDQIIEEQHRLLHEVYTRARNISSAPVRRSAPQYSTDFTVKALKFLKVRGKRPATAPGGGGRSVRPPVLGGPTPCQPRQTAPGTPRWHGYGDASDDDPDPGSYRSASRALSEASLLVERQRLPENHSLDEGQFVRGKKDASAGCSLDPETGNQWLTFSGGGSRRDDHGHGVIEAFADDETEDSYYVIDGVTGSHVSRKMQRDGKIRVGVNGQIKPRDFDRKEWERVEMETVDAERQFVPLCWQDEVNMYSSKVVEARPRSQPTQPKSLCESRPVMFEIEQDGERTASRGKKVTRVNEGYKVMLRSREREGRRGVHTHTRITHVTIGRPTSGEDGEDGEGEDSLSYEDILKMSAPESDKQREVNRPREISVSGQTFNFAQKVKSARQPGSILQGSGKGRNANSGIHRNKGYDVSGVRAVVPVSHTGIQVLGRDAASMRESLVVGNHPTSAKSSTSARAESSVSTHAQRGASAPGRPPVPVKAAQLKVAHHLHSGGGRSGSPSGTCPDAEFIQIAQHVPVPKDRSEQGQTEKEPTKPPSVTSLPGGHPMSRAATTTTTPHHTGQQHVLSNTCAGPAPHSDQLPRLPIAILTLAPRRPASLPKDTPRAPASDHPSDASTADSLRAMASQRESSKKQTDVTPANTPTASPVEANATKFAFDIPTAEVIQSEDISYREHIGVE